MTTSFLCNITPSTTYHVIRNAVQQGLPEMDPGKDAQAIAPASAPVWAWV